MSRKPLGERLSATPPSEDPGDRATRHGRLDRPLTDAEWQAIQPRGRCEAACCTGRGKQRSSDPQAELRDRLCLCKYHHRAIEDGIVGCWGDPPLDVVWRLGIAELGTWYRNEMRLSPEEVKAWFKARRERPK